MSGFSRKVDGGGADEVSYDLPPVRILDDKQWLSIRRQFRMSPRELEVAKLVCIGLSNEQIAARLKIRGGTVKTHLRNVYRRIRVKRKLDMLLKFLSQSMSGPVTMANVPVAVIDAEPVKNDFRSTVGEKD